MEHTITFGGQHYVAAISSRLDNRTLTLKHGDSFAVFDRFGDIQSLGQGEQGLYHEDMRHLSHMELRLDDGSRPVFLNSTIKEDNSLLTVDLTTPDIYHNDKLVIPQDTVHMFRAKLLWNDVCYEHMRIVNYGSSEITFGFAFEFAADFADIFEVRGLKREQKGDFSEPATNEDEIIYNYMGLDHVSRQTRIQCHDARADITAKNLRFSVTLEPKESKDFYLTISCSSHAKQPKLLNYNQAINETEKQISARRNNDCNILTSNEQFNDWLNRSEADLYLLISDTEHGPYPYAGIPWFSTPFGRDGIISALQCLWVNPEIARGVLTYLAATQATELDPERDAEPGKILHERRKGELANIKVVPFAEYYGTVDATPLYIVLAGAYFKRTGDREFLQTIWPNIEAALNWIDEYGDKDRDGFVEYNSQTSTGLKQQGWKDSDDSIFHANGQLAEGDIALCEVQGYVYQAWKYAAELTLIFGDDKKSSVFSEKADRLKTQFNKMFWCDDIGTYALALDGDKNPCIVRSSNAGHTLFSGIATTGNAKKLAATLLSSDSFSGWGIRTIAETESNYNPLSYHNGAVWPHDNALIMLGLSRYGLQTETNEIITGLFDASLFFNLHRMPELFCGFLKRPESGPTLYPVACMPQAWASTVAFAALQACLGIEITATPKATINFSKPQLPPFLNRVRLNRLRVGEATVDLLIRRYEQDVGIIVLRREGNVEINVAK